jgi:hypothetical protein
VTAEYRSYSRFSLFIISPFINTLLLPSSTLKKDKVIFTDRKNLATLTRAHVLLLMHDWQVSQAGNFGRFKRQNFSRGDLKETL